MAAHSCDVALRELQAVLTVAVSLLLRNSIPNRRVRAEYEEEDPQGKKGQAGENLNATPRDAFLPSQDLDEPERRDDVGDVGCCKCPDEVQNGLETRDHHCDEDDNGN